MSRYGMKCWAFGFLTLLFHASISAQTKLSDSFQQRQRDQERARAMAMELVSGVLDVQLRQLEENQLEKLPIYDDIKSMRANLDQLVDREMQEVVRLLVQGQRAPEKERDQIAQDARTKIRSVVVALMAERQKLAKRMQLAKLAAQIRQLIVYESRVLNRVRILPEESPQVRERAMLATLEDQRDVTAFHYQFADILSDVATWDGPIGAGALKGLRLLKTLRIDQELRRADETLAASDFTATERAAQAAIRGWKSLLEVIEETQGLAGADREAMLKLAAELTRRQEAVREQTRQANAQDQQLTERLAQQEHEIHESLGEFAEALSEFPNTEALSEQAKASAFEAEAKLFEGATLEAAQQQSQVIGALAEIVKKLEQSAPTRSEKTADQLAEEVKKLEQLDRSLDQIRQKQAGVNAQAAKNPPAARAAEKQVGQLLQKANEVADFGPALESRLTDAQDQVAQSEQALANAAPQMAAQRTEAAAKAAQTIDQASAEVKHALADARRKQLAVEVGELARAAEALERAAAAEHEISDEAEQAAATNGLSTDEAKLLVKEQASVNKVAKEIAEGVKNTAPQASQQLAALEPGMQSTTQQLQTVQQNPGESSKPAAQQVAKSASQTATGLEAAAKHLRQQAGTAAAELAQLAGQQLQPVVAARQAVDQALLANQSSPSPMSNTALEEALAKTRTAQVEQLRASGRPAAAQAQQMLQRVEAAVRQQEAAERAAREFAQGRTNSPLQAAAEEGEVAELAAEAAADAAGPIQQELELAAAAAEDAAKEMVVGNPNAASAARQAAREALTRAMQAADKAAKDAAKNAPSTPDRNAQEKVSALANEASSASAKDSPEAAEMLGVARQRSDQAVQALANQQPPVAADAQEKAADALAKSAEQLRQAIQAAGKKQSERAAQLADQTAKLADQALPVDAGAAVALKHSATTASEAAEASKTGRQADDPQPEVVRGLERATASLAAREQELKRDQDIAMAIAELAKEQQAARDRIASQAAKLEKFAENRPDAEDSAATPSKEEVAAAQALADAANKFAEAQRATGEGAAEISRQQEVANQPIREGLEAASELGQLSSDQTASTPTPSEEISKSGELRPATGKQDSPVGDAPANKAASELGTDFVPRSPEETARQIAGKDALEEAAKALAAQSQNAADPLAGDLGKKSQLQTAENSARPEDSQAAPAEESAAAKKGEATMAADRQGENRKLDPTRMQQETAAKERDSRATTGNNSPDPADRKFQDEAWFAKLPPALQKAIQSKARRNAPRGYEERLKRYFESDQ